MILWETSFKYCALWGSLNFYHRNGTNTRGSIPWPHIQGRIRQALIQFKHAWLRKCKGITRKRMSRIRTHPIIPMPSSAPDRHHNSQEQWKHIQRTDEKQHINGKWFTQRRNCVTPKIITLPEFPSDKLLTRVQASVFFSSSSAQGPLLSTRLRSVSTRCS